MLGLGLICIEPKPPQNARLNGLELNRAQPAQPPNELGVRNRDQILGVERTSCGFRKF
jgi:hypothetical protein